MTRSRDEAALDLPFLVNGTLDAQARAEVEAWLAADDALRAEAEALAAMRARMQAEAPPSPGDLGLARLMRAVGSGGAVAPGPPARLRMWQAAAVLALGVALAQALWSWGPGGERVRLAGAGGAPGVLVVGFVPEATEAQIRAVLLGLDAEIVGGPSALGLYRLALRDGTEVGSVVAALTAARDIVESVEHVED